MVRNLTFSATSRRLPNRVAKDVHQLKETEDIVWILTICFQFSPNQKPVRFFFWKNGFFWLCTSCSTRKKSHGCWRPAMVGQQLRWGPQHWESAIPWWRAPWPMWAPENRRTAGFWLFKWQNFAQTKRNGASQNPMVPGKQHGRVLRPYPVASACWGSGQCQWTKYHWHQRAPKCRA